MMTYILCSRMALFHCPSITCVIVWSTRLCAVLLTAGDIGREQLSEAVIGYNDLERAKVSTWGTAARTATATLLFPCSWARVTVTCWCAGA